MPNARRSFSYDPEIHPELHAWLESRSNRSLAIRDALNKHVNGGGEAGALQIIIEKLEHIEARLDVLEAGPANRTKDEPEDLAGALDNLGL
jgi:hypothetical protein